MALINQPPRLQLGDAPLAGYAGADTDQVAVIWQTTGSLAGDTFVVEYRAVGDINWTSVPGITTDDTGVGGRFMHEAEIDGLAYSSSYEYRVTHTPSSGSPVVYQAEFDTRLDAGDTSSFTFSAYGDSADPNDLAPFFEVQDRIATLDSDFALLLGDNAYESGTHSQFDSRLATGVTSQGTLDWIASHIDYAAYGNHDANSGGGGYRDGFSTPVPVAGVDSPVGNPAGQAAELNYSFDYGDAHFVTFNSNALNSASQLDTLLDYVEADLAASIAKWKIVYAHHPVGGAPDKGEGPEDNYWQEVVPRLHAAGVDLFLTGHSHTYSWSYPLTGYTGTSADFVLDLDKVYDKGDGLVQVIAGTGGRGIRTGDFGYDFVAAGYSATTNPAADYGFAQVTVSANEIVVDYVMSDDGTVLDSFRIVDDGSGGGGQSTLLTFQNGTNGYTGVSDTFVAGASPTTDNSADVAINVDGSDGGSEVQGLVRFDNLFGANSGQIDVGDTIVSATLYLDVFDPGDSMTLHEMLGAWSDSATWDSLVGIDVTASLIDWQADPTSNFGWALLPTGSGGVDFESSDTSTGPRLVVAIDDNSPPPVNTDPIAQNDNFTVDEDGTVG
ncbi:MAG: metallophosphoesterase, partial [Alphaproteobacteria bacterium]